MELNKRPKNGWHHSDEAKRKISIGHKGLKRSEEVRKKMSDSAKLRKVIPPSRKGIKLTDEHKRKVSEALKGRKKKPMTKAQKKRVGDFFKGRKLALGHRQKISAGLQKALQLGRLPAWKGGVTPENKRIRHSMEYKLWRDEVFRRDDWTCQNPKCRARCKKGKRIELHAHHIESFAEYPELRFAIDNGLALCVPCHEKTENYKRKAKKS